ncbi:MAG: hypothetical protein RL377_1113, partial [Bacteroidota bacterium]
GDAFLTGSGLVRAVPGPIFSVASYTGALALKDKGVSWQIMGAVVAALGIFLPSFLIVLFSFPIWQMLKKFAIFYRSLEGINAAVVGIMLGATIYLSKDFTLKISSANELTWLLSALVFFASTYLVFKQKIATHWMVLSIVLLGICFSYLG